MTFRKFGAWGLIVTLGTLLVLHAWTEIGAFALGAYFTASILHDGK